MGKHEKIETLFRISWAINDTEKTELFQNHLSEVFKPHTIINNPSTSNEVTNYLL